MARPKSMTDFQALIDATNGQGLGRKKPSISLAAGLMMASEGPRSRPGTPAQAHSHSTMGPWSENLFYAYAQKVYTAVPLPPFGLLPGLD